jgi:hypothetical protein
VSDTPRVAAIVALVKQWRDDSFVMSLQSQRAMLVKCANELEAALATQVPAPTALCDCGKPAVCFGAYEGNWQPSFSCADCCGHGNEDGWCKPVEELRAALSAVAPVPAPTEAEDGIHTGDDDLLDHISAAIGALEQAVNENGKPDDENWADAIDGAMLELEKASELRASQLRLSQAGPLPASGTETLAKVRAIVATLPRELLGGAEVWPMAEAVEQIRALVDAEAIARTIGSNRETE